MAVETAALVAAGEFDDTTADALAGEAVEAETVTVTVTAAGALQPANGPPLPFPAPGPPPVAPLEAAMTV